MARRHTPEQVIAKVRQGQKMLNDGHPMVEVIKELQVTEATWYRWVGAEASACAQRMCHSVPRERRHLSLRITARRYTQAPTGIYAAISCLSNVSHIDYSQRRQLTHQLSVEWLDVGALLDRLQLECSRFGGLGITPRVRE